MSPDAPPQTAWLVTQEPGGGFIALAAGLDGAMRAAQDAYNNLARGGELLTWKAASTHTVLLTGVPNPPYQFSDGSHVSYTARATTIAK